MSMEGNAQLSSHSLGAGDAGTINLTLRGPLTMMGTAAIVADTFNSGNGGNVSVTASQINMTGQTLISANTFLSSGHGGNVTVQTGSLSIQGTGNEPSGSLGITAQAALSASGDAGVIDVFAGKLSLNGGAIISSASFSSGNGGSVSVGTSQGQLAGRSLISASSRFTNAGSVQIFASDSFTLSSGSSISTSAGDNGGNITLKVGRLLYLLNSDIQAFAGVVSTPGQQAGGNGGNINIDPEFVVLDNSFISANDLSPGGKDGNITNFANFFFTSGSLLHATGTIETTSPDLDLGGSLVVLPGNLVDVQSKLRESCARSINHEFSTLIVVGRGGTEAAPEELQSDFGLSLRLAVPGAGEAVR
jgi:large exoprotein involved in heme utilization and adhesion